MKHRFTAPERAAPDPTCQQLADICSELLDIEGSPIIGIVMAAVYLTVRPRGMAICSTHQTASPGASATEEQAAAGRLKLLRDLAFALSHELRSIEAKIAASEAGRTVSPGGDG